MNDPEIEVGRIVRAHGLRGQVIVQPASSGSDVLLQVREIRIEKDGRREQRAVREARRHGNTLLVTLEGVSDRNTAEALVPARLLLAQKDLPAPGQDELYVSRLVGLVVTDASGVERGRVIDVESAGPLSWLVVSTASGERLVPLTEPLVRIEADSGRVIVNAPEGLLDGEPL
jgi:16S rRNA processing protein RimM